MVFRLKGGRSNLRFEVGSLDFLLIHIVQIVSGAKWVLGFFRYHKAVYI